MRHKLIGTLLSASILAAGPTCALEITLPPETAAFKPSELPGFALAQRNCMTCHSVHYVQTQPLTSPRGYWDATVKKMKKPFGAQFPDEDIPAMVDYLVKTYGAERSGAAAPVAVVKTSGGVQKGAGSAVDAKALLAANNCMTCHAIDKTVVGPAFKDVAKRYANKPDGMATLAQNIRAGGAGKWGPAPMPPFAQLGEAEAAALARYVLTQ
jgi:sulfite dehydrogenase